MILLILSLWTINATTDMEKLDNARYASLTVTIRDELGNLAENAIVELYETKENYLAEENAVQALITNEKGIVRFKKLKGISYYVLVEKGDLNNYGSGEIIDTLQKGKINQVTIIIS